MATAARLLPFSVKPMPTSELTTAASGSILGGCASVCVAALAALGCAGSCMRQRGLAHAKEQRETHNHRQVQDAHQLAG